MENRLPMLSPNRAEPVAGIADRKRNLARLRTQLPLRHLNDKEFAAIVAHAEVQEMPAGSVLFRAGQDEGWLCYLTEGRVSIADEDGDSFEIEGGSLEALHPLSPHPTARVRGVAASPVRFFRLPSTVVRGSAPSATAGIEVDEIGAGDEEVDNQLLFGIFHALQEGRLELPSLPDVAIRIRAAADDDRKGADDIARIIQADPALATYCVGVANSAAYGGEMVTGIREAVTRMGIPATRDFIVAYAMRGLFKTREPRCMALMHAAWHHSANIGALSYVIARDITRQNPEQAMLAGLLHDIGVMVLVAALPQQPALLRSERTLRAALRDLKHQITGMVLRAWKLPDVLSRAAFVAEHWTREPGPQLDLGDTVLLAHWHQEARNLPWADAVPALGAAALRRIPVESLTDEGHLRIVAEARDELGKLTNLLGGH